MSEKSPIDEQWDSLVDDWQSQPYEKVDTNKLIKQLKKRTFYAKLVLFLDVIATVGLAWSFFWSLDNDDFNLPTTIYLGVGAVGSLIYTILAFNIRFATWRMDASDPEQVFHKNMSALKGAIQYANLWVYSCYIILPLGNWFVWEIGKTTEKSMFYGYVFMNSLTLFMIACGLVFKARRQRELDSMNEIING
ncbi:hypothetical protein ACFSJY_00660 [Thalassotalea euphylliae]|uniref:hypothetical protein n=1 Tax=Thalassotalea euphylliae TaxID=1655234 RepID=UPI0036411BDC